MSAGFDELDNRRRKLRFRSWHRGMREMDLILGPFADMEIAGLTGIELDHYEQLLETPDAELLGYVTGQKVRPSGIDTAMLDRIIAFRRQMTF